MVRDSWPPSLLTISKRESGGRCTITHSCSAAWPPAPLVYWGVAVAGPPPAAGEARSARSWSPSSPPPSPPPPSSGVSLAAGVSSDVGVLPPLLSLLHAARSATNSASAATRTRPFIPHRPKLKTRPPCIILLPFPTLQRAERQKIYRTALASAFDSQQELLHRPVEQRRIVQARPVVVEGG